MIPDVNNLRERKERIDKEIAIIQSSSLTKENFEIVKELIDQSVAIEIELDAERRRAERMIEECNLGRRFKSRIFENFDNTRFPMAYEKVKLYAERFTENCGESLLLMGNPGTGKTHLAAAATNYIVQEHGIPVRFGSFMELLERMKATFYSAEDVGKELVEVPLLVIDDLGKERQSEWSNAVLYRVINGRYERYAPVIITTNENLDTLRNNVGEATFSRLIEMCEGVSMNGEDYRMRKLR